MYQFKDNADFKYGGAEVWEKAVQPNLQPFPNETLACSSEYIPFVFRSFLNIEMHQLHQLRCHCQFILVKSCSDKVSSDGFIKVNQKKTKVIDGKLSKSYQVHLAVFQELEHIFQYCSYNIVTTILSLHSFQTFLFICD